MRLIRLTPTNGKAGLIPIISPHWITGMEASNYETIIYTARQGLYHRVVETPEQIESLLNSEPNLDPSANQLLRFAQWQRENGTRFLGKSMAEMVNTYVQELRSAQS